MNKRDFNRLFKKELSNIPLESKIKTVDRYIGYLNEIKESIREQLRSMVRCVKCGKYFNEDKDNEIIKEGFIKVYSHSEGYGHYSHDIYNDYPVDEVYNKCPYCGCLVYITYRERGSYAKRSDK